MTATDKARKRLGPFTGAQLTIIIVSTIVVVLFPVGAWAAYSVSHVTITDNSGANVAGVDAKHNLDTAIHDQYTGTAMKVDSLGHAVVSAVPSVPSSSFDKQVFATTGPNQTLIPANQTTVALSRVLVDNGYNQTAGAHTSVALLVVGGTAKACDGSGGSRIIARYNIAAGQSFADVMGSPLVLKPYAAGQVWCLQAVTLLEGNPMGYVNPSIEFSGWVISGSLPATSLRSSPIDTAPTSRRATP
jgi:hypothetical protein